MSIRSRLFLILMIATSLVWLSAAALIGQSTRAKVERMLDARLSEAATMVASLIPDQGIAAALGGPLVPPPAAGYHRQLACQVWSVERGILARSAGAPAEEMAGAPGLSTVVLGGETWRVFTIETAGLRISVGDRTSARDGLVRDVVKGLLLPAALVLPLLAAVIWLGLARGLAPLRRLEAELHARSPDEVDPLPAHPVPAEIRPVRDALNGLFARLQRAREAERDFTAFAAHELKTPLAGLRMQAQIAARAPDEATRARALSAITASVDRTDRLARQLLDLAAVERAADPADGFSPAALADEVLADLAPLAQAQKVRIIRQFAPAPRRPQGGFLFRAALRNVVENAIQASPDAAEVTVTLGTEGGQVVLAVRDAGPGIDEAERPKVTQHFYRGAGARPGGSGLGLVIAAGAMARLGGGLTLCPSDGWGQRVELTLPSPPSSPTAAGPTVHVTPLAADLRMG
ncbi:sensor histidine kinase N-terminal domain-containing protein [Cereibacter sphaeroides]|uniref:ATP-binding protein n=1 Tax=Cereibacter sphaeroides TaxID=1063 RepID=UPI001F2849E8|nr:ATP-binding protein [Cereibacter sphaeroides]MCE6950618.1 sensor histidine kinase N-terminal domain-containing protein [Cereibacter sphaeroides]